MICEKCGETLPEDTEICKCGESTSKPSAKTAPSRPRFSLLNALLTGVAAVVLCLYIAAAIYYLNDGFGGKSVPSGKNIVAKNIQKPKVDVPPVAPSDAKPVVKEPPPVAAIKQSEVKSTYKEDVQNVINKWLTGWQSGNMETYRSCYAADFQSKGMNLDAWINNKINVRKKSGNISISIEDVKISGNENAATAVFTQHYSSSKSKDSGKKTLELKKINNEWRIYKEIM